MSTGFWGRVIGLLMAAAMCLLIVFGGGKAAYAETNLISSQQELLDAINAAEDGDVLLVGDIDFTAPTGIFNEMMRVQLRKSITISSGIPGDKAVFTNGSFLLRGSKVSGETLECAFENIIFDGAVDTAGLTAEDWERPYDESIQNYTSQYPLKAQYAVSFTGNVTASFVGCVFQNYMYEYGGAIWCRYRDYTDNPYYLDLYGDYSSCQLEVTLADCRFAGNAAYYAGGAVYLDGNQDNVTLRGENCVFENNHSALNDLGQGGGAIYAQYAAVELVGCDLIGNRGNRDYDMEGEEFTRGGAIHMSNGNLTMTDCTVADNAASLGGGLCLTNTATVLDGCVLTGNRAAAATGDETGPWTNAGMGGAMYVETERSIPVSVYNSSIYRNSACNAYGGVYGFYNEDYPGLLSQGYGKMEFYFCTVAENLCDTAYDYTDPSLWLWYSHPGDVWQIPYVTAVGCLILEESYEEDFPRQELPGEENGYCYYGFEGVTLEEREGHLRSDSWEVPGDYAQAVLKGRYGQTLSQLWVGSNYDAALYRPELPETPDTPSYSPELPQAEPGPEPEEEKFPWIWLLIPVGGAVAIAVAWLILLNRKRGTQTLSVQSEPAPAPTIILTRYTKEQIDQIIQAMPQTQRLTPRELEVLQEMLMGKKQSEIAYELGISVPTVKDNARRIYDKLEVQNKSELFIKAQSAIE